MGPAVDGSLRDGDRPDRAGRGRCAAGGAAGRGGEAGSGRAGRELVNTVGAGDALLSAFVHGYAKMGDPYQAIEKAIVFASWKIGEDGGSQGFLDEPALDRLYAVLRSSP